MHAIAGHGSLALVPGIRDIADVLGVSASTVSRALSGSRLVSEGLRVEVRRVAEELGYVRRVRRRRRGIVNLRVVTDDRETAPPLAAGDDLGALMFGLREGLAGRGLNLFCDAGGPEYDPFSHKKGGDTDAFVVFQRVPDERVLETISGQGTPVVVVNQVVDGWPCVAPDHLDGMDRLVGHLVERANDLHPCFVAVEGAGGLEQERLDGMAGACLRRGVEFEADRDVILGAGFREAAAAVTARCSAGVFNAAVCMDDPTAVAVCGELGRAGIAVGSRVLVTGFGGHPMARLLRPAPATIEVSIEALGRRAAMMIGRWLGGEEAVAGIERIAGNFVPADNVPRAGG